MINYPASNTAKVRPVDAAAVPFNLKSGIATTSAKAPDAIKLLIADHKSVKQRFDHFEDIKESASVNEKYELVREICADLLIHMEIEEKIFYPAMQKKAKDDEDEEMMDEAYVEHTGAKDLIAKIGKLDPDDAMFNATVKVLSEQIEHHVEEEEDDMFKDARSKKLDLEALGQQLLDAKTRLRAEHGMDPSADSGN